MTSPELDRPRVRISRVAGRYLVFDIDDVAHIRRHHGICAVFTGTMPQNPTQNVFLGLPIELYAEEAKRLVAQGAAYIADDPMDHIAQLSKMDDVTRRAYLQSVKTQRKTAQLVFEEARAESQAKHKDKRKPKETGGPAAVVEGREHQVDEEGLLFAPQPAAPKPVPAAKDTTPAITPTTSNALIVPDASSNLVEVPTSSYPMQEYLNSRGYFITPGLRFGGDFSVYPGDPYRYHAHYLANSYDWDEKIPMLDLLTSGRLGTAVKKSFLLGGQQPAAADQEPSSSSSSSPGDQVRVFCIEWAGM